MLRTCLAVTLLLVLSLGVSAEGELNVFFLNVGHGDAILVDFDHWEILIDTGTKQYWEGSSYCMDLLDKYVSKPIEVFVLSHPDRDHYNGFDLIETRFGVVSVWHGPDLADEASGESYLTEVVPRFCERVLSWTPDASPILTGPLEWRVLHPLTGASGEDDENSLVLSMSFGSTTFIFSGDIHASQQREIMKRFPGGLVGQAETCILKLPHHGSATHVVAEFYDWAEPDYAICSSVDRCEAVERVFVSRDCPLLVTANTIAIHVFQAAPNLLPSVRVLK